jgi:hypothetical protein
MIILNDEQGSEAWLRSRLGKISASRVDSLITPTGKPSAQADKYINELIAQRLSGELPETYTNAHMERGNELEPSARALYELVSDCTVDLAGFCLHPDLPAGFSPDGFISTEGGLEGGLEIKCPAPHTHVEYLRKGKVPTKYIPQIQMALWISGRAWWDFMSYHPKIEPLIVRVERDEAYIEKLAQAVTQAAMVIDQEVERLATTKGDKNEH